jgi:peroxiredoxin
MAPSPALPRGAREGVVLEAGSEEVTMSKKIQVDTTAPDFTLEDSRGRTVRLSNYRGNKHVFLVFNRGFM